MKKNKNKKNAAQISINEISEKFIKELGSLIRKLALEATTGHIAGSEKI